MPKKYTYKELEPRIKEAITKKAGMQLFADEGSISLIDGFIFQNLQPEIGGDLGFVIGGGAIPIVGVVGGKTGKIYYFALKALLPDLDL